MQNYVSIIKDDLYFNAKEIVDFVKTPVIAVVKCNGYGLSIELAVKAWYDNGVRFFGVSEPQEALEVRETGVDADVLLMAPVSDENMIKKLIENDVILTVTDEQSVLAATAHAKKPVRVHIKINTGMGRFGYRWTDTKSVQELYSMKSLQCEGIFSHFAASFEKGRKRTDMQLSRFRSLLDALEADGVDTGIRHIANSCAALRFPDTRLDAVRVGSALTGKTVCDVGLKLKKVGCMMAQVVDMQTLEKGDTSGYAMLYKAKRKQNTAIIALGSQHGFGLKKVDDSFRLIDVVRSCYHALRSYKKPMSVDFDGKRLAVAGRTGNQYTLVDCGNSSIGIGDYVRADCNIMLADSRIKRVLEEQGTQ